MQKNPPVLIFTVKSFLVIILFALFCGPAYGAFNVGNFNGVASIGNQVELLEDPTASMSVEAVMADDALQWKQSDTEVLNFSFSKSAYWIRIGVQNSSPDTRKLYLHAKMPLHDYFKLYVVEKGSIVKKYVTGDRYNFDTRPIARRTFYFPIEVRAESAAEIYLQVNTYDGLYDALPLYLMDELHLLTFSDHESFIYGYYYGAILALLLVNLLVFFSTRQKMFLYYSIYLLSFLVWNFSFRGYGFEYVWPDFPFFNNQIIPVSSTCIFLSLLLFVINYLDLKKKARIFYRVGLGLLIVNALTLIPAFMGLYAFSFALIMPAGIVTLIFVMVTAAVQFIRGYREAKFFILAWSVLIFGAIIYYLSVMGVVPSNRVTENILNAGSIGEFILLALALADKINILSGEKLEAEQKALSLQKKMTEELDMLVKKRTSELESANGRLQEMSVTDALTGIHNRHYFNIVVPREVLRAQRRGLLLTFCILDVDFFKQYNDNYGHQRGDHVLQEVGRVLKEHLRRPEDHFFRLGGEEFGILIVGEQGENHTDYIEKIRAAIEALSIEHRGSRLGVLTASFGVASFSDPGKTDVEKMYVKADSALYQAKEKGRNRIENV